ncbi:MAG: response regulator [Alcaligenaceae bacterium]
MKISETSLSYLRRAEPCNGGNVGASPLWARKINQKDVSVTDLSIIRSPTSVLVVDDDDFALESMREALAPLKFASIATATDGFAALRHIKSSLQPPDVLICDVYMPNMDGLEFLDQLAQMQFKGGVILVSGLNIEMLGLAREIAIGSGLQLLGAFTKPVPQSQLLAALGLAPGD